VKCGTLAPQRTQQEPISMTYHNAGIHRDAPWI
jgi:hypothetical protein